MDLRVWLALGALCALALLYASCGLKSAFAPFCACCTAVVWFSLMGPLGLLKLGGWLFYAVALAAAVYLVWRHGLRKKPLPALGFGWWFFVGASVLVLVLLQVKQPLFLYWDEFSFWGTAGKLVKLGDELYTTAAVGWRANPVQKPGLVVLSYFFQFFGRGFAEWQTYAAYDVFMLAGLATVLVAFEEKKGWNAALPVMLVLLLAPFAFRHGIFKGEISNVYLDSTAELPLACCFGAVLVLWLGGEKRRLSAMGPVCLGLATLVLLKDAALGFALVAAVLVFADALFGSRLPGASLKRHLGGALARLALGLAAVLVVFAAWEGYSGIITGQSRMQDVGGSAQAGMLQLPGLFLRDLLSPEKSVRFSFVTGEMARYFTQRSTMFGSGLVVVLGIWAMLAAAALIADKKSPLRRGSLVFGIFSTLGFWAYYFLIACSYLYIMAESEAMVLASYDRYFYPFYMGWFLAALFLFCKSALQTAKQRLGAAAKTALVALGALLLLRTNQLVPLNYNLVGVHPEDYNERREFTRHAQWVGSLLDEDGKVFMVLSEDGGLGIFKYVHELLPQQVDYSYGGGPELRQKVALPGGGTEEQEITAEQLARHLADSGCTRLYIDSINERFISRYGQLFSDGLAGWQSGETRLYEVVVQDGEVQLRPLPMPAQSPA